ncbi:hypothetical protein [uncultured Mediterranean phage uvDeep-CGR2-AD7-C12]|nr:hypothetical protein [uncultured Mediterranean phage uvDeep-CGR2-AD7-C12]
MARGFAYAYKQGQRPADEPAGNYKTLKPEGHAVGRDRRIHRVNPTPTHDPLVATPSPLCVAITKKGVSCKGHPIGDTDTCVFHKE